MLLATLALGGAILGATTIAGLLMLYQIRATTDSEHSAQAIFAADTGVEWTLFDFYCDATSTVNVASRCVGGTREQTQPGIPPGTLNDLGNGTAFTVNCYDATGATVVLCSSTSTAVSGVSKGVSLDAQRAFFLSLSNATATLP